MPHPPLISRPPLWHIVCVLVGLIICTVLVLLHVPASMLLPWFFLAIISVLTADAVLGAGTGIAATVLSGFLLYAVPPNGRPVPLETILLAEVWFFGTCLLVWILTQRLRRKVYALALERENALPTPGMLLPGPHHLYARLVDESPDGVVVVDSAGLMVLVNQETERLFGYTRDDLLGNTVDILLPAALRTIHHRHHTGYLTAPTRRPMGTGRELVAQRKDGSTFPVEISLSPLHRGPEEGGTLLVKAVIRDIAQRRREQDALARERAHRESAEQAIKDRDLFLSTAAHEIKTPLTSIRGYTELLQEISGQLAQHDIPYPADVLPRIVTAQRSIAVIARQATKMQLLIDRILDVTRMEMRRFSLHYALTDIVLLTQNLFEPLRDENQMRQLTLRIEPPDPGPIHCDGIRIEQVLNNLLSNALTHTPEETPILMTLTQTPLSTIWRVCDRGKGIALTDRSLVFTRFYQAQRAAGVAGLGLGLYICKQLVDLHGGGIVLSDNPGGGLCVEVTIPNEPVKVPLNAE